MADFNKYHNGRIPSNNDNGYSTFGGKGIDVAKQDNIDDEIDLKQIFYMLWNRKWLIVGAVLFFGLLAGIYSYTVTPIYQSNGLMLISEPQNSYSSGGSDLGSLLSSSYGIGVGSTIANELEVLRSRKLSVDIADTLIKERVMTNGKQFPVLFKDYPDDSTILAKDVIAEKIRKQTSFKRVNRDADVISVVFNSPSPIEAAHIANLTIALYKNLSTRQNRASAYSAVSFLENERDRIKSELGGAEEELRNFMNQNKLIQVDTQTEQLINQMAALEAQRQEARTKLVAANSAIEQYQDQLDTIKPGLAEQYSEAIGSDITRLQYAKSELEVGKQQLLAKNPGLSESSPQIADKNRQIEVYKKRIRELTQNLIDEGDQYLGFIGGGEAGIAQNVSELNQKLIELQVQQKQYSSQIEIINSQLNQQEQFFNNLPNNIIDLAQLRRDVKINEELYIAVSQQYAETALWEQTQFGLGRIIDRGYMPVNPVKPNKALYILVGFILGGVLSIGFLITKDSFNTTIDAVEKMRKLEEPLLSVIPAMGAFIKEHNDNSDKIKIQGKHISTSLITVQDSASPISESFRRLENNLIYSNPDSKMKSIIITSSGKGEGKTTTISNLGVVLSEAGYNTIIVDTDFRRPNLHNMFGINQTPGFMEILFDDISIQEVIQQTIVPGLSILPSGRRPPNAASITQSQAFLGKIKKLENHYDFVLIDTPPFGIIADASPMLRQTDGVVVAARFGETTEVQLGQTLEQLHHLNANVMGTVLTAFDHEKSTDYYLGSSYYKNVYKDYNTYQSESV